MCQGSSNFSFFFYFTPSTVGPAQIKYLHFLLSHDLHTHWPANLLGQGRCKKIEDMNFRDCTSVLQQLIYFSIFHISVSRWPSFWMVLEHLI